jgi:uncharacterized membrane protein
MKEKIPEEITSGRALLKYKVHWHVVLTHFPISFFIASFLFQILHLFPNGFTSCFEIATNITLIFATAVMIPTIITGWFTWKRSYGGVDMLIFRRKTVISYVLFGFAVVLVIWRSVFFGVFVDIPYGIYHWLYLAGNVLLIAGAAAEGFYGERLSHR